MWVYEKKLEYPVKIKNPNPRMAKYIITQYGGPDGELNLLYVQNPLFIRVLKLIVYIYFSLISYLYSINQFS
ncbi:MAG: Manganese containing catalase [Firmicutes bacterium ADurb.Bin419]|nr:MAG: Manganese containing catalase [Firmicutes bacterium ADurb.Bin419]